MKQSMHWTIEFIDETYVLVVTHGTFTAQGQIDLVEDILTREFWRPGRLTLFDHRDLDFSESTIDTIQSASDTHVRNDERIGKAKTAIVLKDSLAYGNARQFMGITRDMISATLALFTDMDSAKKWLLDAQSH